MGPRIGAAPIRFAAVLIVSLVGVYTLSASFKQGPVTNAAIADAGALAEGKPEARRQLAQAQKKVMVLLSSLLTTNAPARAMVSNVLEPNTDIEVRVRKHNLKSSIVAC